MSRPSKQQLLPYKLIMLSLYGRMNWVSRDRLGVIRLPVPKLASHFRTRAGEISKAVSALKDWQLIEDYKWWGSYVEITPFVPEGMCVLVSSEIKLPSDVPIIEVAGE